MHKPFHDILHPPELQGREQRRYWFAVGGWFVLTMGLTGSIMFLLYQMVVWLEGAHGTEALRPYESWILGSVLLGGGVGIFLGDYLWGKVFVKSGYLSPAAAIRIRTNRAPTARGERIHRRLSLTYAAMIPLLFMGMAWYLEAYWLIAVALVFGVWFFIIIWAGWQQANDMVAERSPYPKDEVRRVLHDIDPPSRDGAERP